MPSIVWVGLIQSVEALKGTETELPEAEGVLQQDAFRLRLYHQLSGVSSLLANTADFGLPSLHNRTSQFLIVNLLVLLLWRTLVKREPQHQLENALLYWFSSFPVILPQSLESLTFPNQLGMCMPLSRLAFRGLLSQDTMSAYVLLRVISIQAHS